MKRSAGVRHRDGRGSGALAVSAGVALALPFGSLACSERERPDRLHDQSLTDARRVLSGSFHAPVRDAGANGGASGAGSDCDASARCPQDADASAGASGGAGPDPTGPDPAPAGPVTVRQSYAAFCEDSTVQWGFFTCRATTPDDSSIRLRIRTAPTEDALPAATFLDLLTVNTELGTNRCTVTGPAPCPVDLFALLGGPPLAHEPLSELEVVLSPSSVDQRLPTIDDWQLTYSCTFNQ